MAFILNINIVIINIIPISTHFKIKIPNFINFMVKKLLLIKTIITTINVTIKANYFIDKFIRNFINFISNFKPNSNFFITFFSINLVTYLNLILN